MKTKILTYSLLLMIFVGCEGMLDKYPLSQMSPESFFSTENELEAFSNTFYTIFPEVYGESCDNYVQMQLPAEMRDGRMPSSVGGWSWGALRNYNTLLEMSVNCPDEKVRTKYNALARFFRAYFYFEKVKRFGDVPWYDRQLGSDDPELMKPRDSREFIMQKVIEDLDFAIENLPDTKSVYRVTRWTALALKSRICLFEGTFRKYHDVTYPEHDWQWYLSQSALAAETFINTSGYSLYKSGNKSYLDLFASQEAIGQEIILARDYNEALGVVHNASFYTMSQSYGRPGMTRKIVASYLMADGSRFTEKEGWEKMSFKDECKNRDPRLAQTIRTPGYTRIGSSKKLAPDLSVSVTGYQLVKFVAGEDSDAYNKSHNDLPLFRTAEVYLNFAEAKAELGTLSEDDVKKSINKIRERAGMPAFDMSVNPDPYLLASETGYPEASKKNAGKQLAMILEIRRERTIELAQEGFRYYDMMRWREGNAFTQPLYGIYFDKLGDHDLDGDGTVDVCLYKDEKPASSKAKLALKLNQDFFLSEGEQGYMAPHKKNPGKWDENRDYLYPIPTEDRALTNGALTQNPGWNDGLDL